jgi:hypothetical protein
MRLFAAFTSNLLAVAFLLSPAGCKLKSEKPRVGAGEEAAPARLTMLHVADPRASAQLVKGYHKIEQNAWRWTMGRFAVTLRPPVNASRKGARLILRCTVPAVIIHRLTAVSLAANVEGVRLPEETYSRPGEYVYSHDVPADVLTTEAVKVEFSLDKYLPPGDADQRELGVIVSMVGFEAK